MGAIALVATGLSAAAAGKPPASPAPASPKAPVAAQPASAAQAQVAPAGDVAPRIVEPVWDDPVRAAVLHAWALPSRSLEERVNRTLQKAHRMGIRQLDAPARALLLSSQGDPLERAQAAVTLAPDLPAAWGALAQARRAQGDWAGCVSALLHGARAVPRHLDAHLWARTEGLKLLADALLLGAGAFLLAAALAALPTWLRDLRALRPQVPGPSWLALLASLALLPAALGEGPLGLLAGLALLAAGSGPALRRAAVLGAALLACIAVYPALDRAAATLSVLVDAPVAVTAYTVERELPSAGELARVERVSAEDPLAARAAALYARRAGDRAAAERRYASLIGDDAAPDLLNNAANVRLAAGDAKGAIDLYERAADRIDSPVIWFNLSQAYGRAIRLDDQDHALARAQSLDADAVAKLSHTFGRTPGLAADLPLTPDGLVGAARGGAAARAVAATLRLPLAPGLGGRGPWHALVLVLGLLAAGVVLGGALHRGAGNRADHYTDVARALQSGGDAGERAARITELRLRRAREERLARLASWVVPGAAGVLRGRPLRGLVASLVFGLGVALALAPTIPLADPLALGGLPGALLEAARWLALAAYLSCLLLCFAGQEEA